MNLTGETHHHQKADQVHLVVNDSPEYVSAMMGSDIGRTCLLAPESTLGE